MFQEGQTPVPVPLTPVGGLNLALQSSEIGENELSIAYNMTYDPSTGRCSTRRGLRMATANALPNPIDILHSHVRINGTGYIICVSDSDLYYLSGGTWVLIESLDTDRPVMISFNGNLLVADGSSSGILSWDGTTASRIAGSPPATVVYEQANRVVANSTTDADLDAVFFSGPEDETDWNTATGNAVTVRAGFGDGQKVNGFATISDMLIISKVAFVDGKISKKKFFGINTAGASTDWSATDVSAKNAAVDHHAMQSIGQDVIYVDTQGIEALTPTQEFGDIATDPVVGGKVNEDVLPLVRSSDFVNVVQTANLASLWFFFGTSRIYVYSLLTRAFTEVEYSTPIRHMVDHGDATYVAGDDGQLYYIADGSGDELTTGVYTDYTGVAQFKMITGTGDLLLTTTHLNFEYLNPGTYEISVSSGEYREKTVLQSVDLLVAAGDDFLHEATDELVAASYDLGSTGTSQRIPCRAKYRGDGILLQVRTKNYGRISIGGITPIIAQVGK